MELEFVSRKVSIFCGSLAVGGYILATVQAELIW